MSHDFQCRSAKRSRSTSRISSAAAAAMMQRQAPAANGAISRRMGFARLKLAPQSRAAPESAR